MVYKKYIEKDGKIYGPYVYHSRRINGKIVSEYCGHGKASNKKLLVFVFIGLILLLLLSSFFIFKNKFTGKVVSENSNVILGEKENVISYPSIYFTLISIQNKRYRSLSWSLSLPKGHLVTKNQLK